MLVSFSLFFRCLELPHYLIIVISCDGLRDGASVVKNTEKEKDGGRPGTASDRGKLSIHPLKLFMATGDDCSSNIIAVRSKLYFIYTTVATAAAAAAATTTYNRSCSNSSMK